MAEYKPFDNASLDRLSSQSRILVTPQWLMKPLKIIWRESLREGRLPST